MKEAVIRMETAARPTTDRSASPRLLKGLLLAITLVALLATTVILCQQDMEFSRVLFPYFETVFLFKQKTAYEVS